MSKRNGDRARFHKDRKRKLIHRQRIAALAAKLRTRAAARSGAQAPSGTASDRGGSGAAE